jgi:hypothetical protein
LEPFGIRKHYIILQTNFEQVFSQFSDLSRFPQVRIMDPLKQECDDELQLPEDEASELRVS